MHSQDLGHSRPRQAAATVFRSWSRLPRLFIGIVLAAVCTLASGTALAADVRIDDIRIASHGPITRVVIDLSAPVDFHHLALGQPPRLAIDLPEADWTLDEDASKAIGLIKGLRFGHPSPGVSRIVLDMAQPFEIKRIFELPPNGERGHRVVTDLIGMAPGGVNGVIRPAAGVAGSQTAAMTVIRPPAFKPSPPPEKRIVVIDPGHGGVDPGAIGTKLKLYEKDVALRTALALRSRLEKTGRYEVVMTREDDRIVRLRDRLRIARDSGGELFVSLHADSLVRAPEIRGASVYTLSERASNQEAERLARKENRADILAGIDLSNQEDIVTEILIDLAQRDTNNKSIELAEALVQELGGVTRMARRRRAQAGFVVLKSPDMPSVLVELGYLSNAADEKALADEGHIAALAGAVARAIDVYFGVGPS